VSLAMANSQKGMKVENCEICQRKIFEYLLTGQAETGKHGGCCPFTADDDVTLSKTHSRKSQPIDM